MSKEAMRAVQDAMETARNGLQWYREMHPEDVDGSDAEADEQIDAALSLLRAELEAGGEAVAQPTGVERMEQALRDQEAHFEMLYASPVAADTQGDAKDADGEPITPARLVAWLDAKYARHGEEEDKWCADYIRAALSPTLNEGKKE